MAYIYDWSRMTGAPADGDLVAMIDVSDKSMSADGTNKTLESSYIVFAADGVASRVNGGGVINLGGHTFNFTDGGTLDLNDNTMAIGGNLTTDSVVTIAGAVFTYNGIGLTMTSAAAFDLGGVTLTVSGDTLAIDGTPIPSYNPNGTLDLGGSSMSADGAGNLTLDGNVINTSAVMEGTAGATNEVATFDASGDLQGGNLIGGGANALTLTASTVPATLEVKSSGTLDLSSNTLDIDGGNIVLSGGGTIALGAQTLTVTGGGALALGTKTVTLTGANFTITGGGTLNLGGNTVVFGQGGTLNLNNQVNAFTGSGTLDLGVSNTLAIKTGSVTVNGGGTVNLAGYTITVPKTGTVAMTSDLGGTTYNYITVPVVDNSFTGGSSYVNVGHCRWLGTQWGAQSPQFWVGFNVTGTGTAKVRVICGADTPYEKTHSTGSSASYDEDFYWTTAPATDQDITVAMSETSNSIYGCYLIFRIEV